MKRRLPSLFDLSLLLLVIAAVVLSSMLAGNKLTETPRDVSTMEEELRQTTQRFTDWEEFGAVNLYVQIYKVRFTGEDALHPENWPEADTEILLNYGACPAVGRFNSLRIISDDTENPVLEATISCFCAYSKTGIMTPSGLMLSLGRIMDLCLADGTKLGVGTIVEMN